jgi:hypothetical protein
MKKLIMIALTVCVFVLSQGFRKAAADQGYTPLEALAGTYGLTAQGSFFFCFVPSPFAPAQCGSPGSTGVPIGALQVGAITYDTAGNSCATFTETETVLPVDAFSHSVFVFSCAGKTTSYDPITGTGEDSFTCYSGGQCHGATFDSTGATVVSTGTEHFVVSDRAKRVDVVATSLTTPEGSIGSFSFSNTALRQ